MREGRRGVRAHHSVADHPHVRRLIELALEEDMPHGDLTTDCALRGSEYEEGVFRLKSDGVVAGLPLVEAVLHRIDPTLGWECHVDDGDHAGEGAALATVAGRATSILAAERTALNFLQRLSGIATATFELVRVVSHTKARVCDTRKTLPGWRLLDKYAVRMGGGANHRFSLSDGILIKDNHVEACGGIKPAVAAARARAPHLLRIEVECGSLEQVQDALDAETDVILLDNMDPPMLRRAVELVNGRALLEASGGVTLATAKQVAEAGVDLISVGSLTHSVTALDISLDFVPPDDPSKRRLQRTR